MDVELRKRKEIKPAPVKGGSVRRIPRKSMNWDSLLWVFAAFAVLYFSEFASHLLFNSAVRRPVLLLSMVFLCFSACCLVYSLHHYPSLGPNNWDTVAPVHVAAATISLLVGASSLWVAVWPVWRFYTILILPTLFMGFISAVSLFNL